MFSKKPKGRQTFGPLLWENLLPIIFRKLSNLVTLVVRHQTISDDVLRRRNVNDVASMTWRRSVGGRGWLCPPRMCWIKNVEKEIKLTFFSCVACFGGCPCGQYYCLALKCVQGIEDGERNKEKKGKSHETTLHVDSVTRFGEISSLWQILTSL